MDKMDPSSGTFVLTVTHNHPAVLFGLDAPLLFHLTNPGFLEGGWLGLGAAGCGCAGRCTIDCNRSTGIRCALASSETPSTGELRRPTMRCQRCRG